MFNSGCKHNQLFKILTGYVPVQVQFDLILDAFCTEIELRKPCLHNPVNLYVRIGIEEKLISSTTVLVSNIRSICILSSLV